MVSVSQKAVPRRVVFAGRGTVPGFPPLIPTPALFLFAVAAGAAAAAAAARIAAPAVR